MNEFAALLVSYVFIFAVLGITQVLLKANIVTASVSRKIVHIGVAHWWLFAMFFIESTWVALIGPVSFIGLNYLSYRTHLFRSMEHETPRKNLGTVYYPIALTGLVLLSWLGPFPKWYGLVAMLALGWGDGMAALVGEAAGRRANAHRFELTGGSKTIAGTLAMIAASGTVVSLGVWLFSGPLASGAQIAPVEAGYGLWNAMVRLLTGIGSQTWVGESTDATVLFALSRFDHVARAVGQLAGELFDPAKFFDPATWQLAPTTILAVATIIAIVAAATELVTPWGLDNITIPFVVFAVLALLLPLPSEWLVRLAWALALNVGVAAGAYLKKSVTAGGALAGAGVGFVIYLSGGVFFWSVLIAFFVGSSVLSKVKAKERQRSDAERITAKGSRRDAVQVLANGGLAALAAVLHALTGRPVFLLAFGIALAAANADTWASEIGVFSTREPVSILGLRPVPRGTSGGVSPLGFVASAAGALFIGLWFAVGYWITNGWNFLELGAIVAAITGGGFIGSVIDSLLGATVQARYWDDAGNRHTERRHNGEGLPNRLVKGFHFFTNDMVNALSGLASVVAMIVVVA